VFQAPDLPEETLLDREHNETLAKLNFVLALVDCILELAETKTSPLSILTDSVSKEVRNGFLFNFLFDLFLKNDY
jgi:serine/threonine-protein kinase ULK/ATG1